MERRNQFRVFSATTLLRVASLWWWIGKHIGVRRASIVVLDSVPECPLIAIMVWLGYLTARTIAPERIDLRIRRAATTGFHSSKCVLRNEQRCVVAAVFRRAVPLLLQWLERRPPIWLGASTGVAIAATYLTKLSNLPLIGVAVLVIILKLQRNHVANARKGLAALAALLVCAAIPIGSWMVWTQSAIR